MGKITNSKISIILRTMGYVREVKGKEWSARSYISAADKAEVYHVPIRTLTLEDIKSIDGFGSKIATLTFELASGKMPDDVKSDMSLYPKSLFSLTKIPGVGPKGAVSIYEEHKVCDLKGMVRLAKKGMFTKAMRRAIAFTTKAKGERLALGDASRIANTIRNKIAGGSVKKLLMEESGGDPMCQVMGSIRRREDTIGDIDILVGTDDTQISDRIRSRFLKQGVEVVAGPSKCSIYYKNKVRVDLLIVPVKHWGAALLYFTGSKEHNIALRKRAGKMGFTLNEFGLYKGNSMLAGATERGIYRHLGLKAHPPTKRSGSTLREEAD